MFKLTGSIFVLFSAVVLFASKPLVSFFTFRMLVEAVELCNRLMYENNNNITYEELFFKIGFDKSEFTKKYSGNPYISKTVLSDISAFVDNLGRHDIDSEEKYILHNLKKFEKLSEQYQREYAENFKAYTLGGISAGIFIIILVI